MANNAISVSTGDDLYRVAARLYGDAAAWTLLARANGLTDPVVQADAVLSVPDYNAARAADGVLSNQ
jgi:hypothetical protein